MWKAVHQFYCTSASPRWSADDWWHPAQLTTAGDDKNVQTHSLDRKLAILEQLAQRSWSDGTSCNVPDLSSKDVWLSAGRQSYSPLDTWWMYTNLIIVNSFFSSHFGYYWARARRQKHWHEKCFSPPAAKTTHMREDLSSMLIRGI